MITTFNTTTGSSDSKSSNILLYALGIAIVGYGLYKFVYLPMKEKKEQNEAK
jgi:hypothetical protein